MIVADDPGVWVDVADKEESKVRLLTTAELIEGKLWEVVLRSAFRKQAEDEVQKQNADSLNLDFEKREGLLFVGGFAHPPNADAVLWFAKEVFPLIRARLKVNFYVVGSKVTEEIKALEQPGNGIIVKGFVSEEELSELYRNCRLVGGSAALARRRQGARWWRPSTTVRRLSQPQWEARDSRRRGGSRGQGSAGGFCGHSCQGSTTIQKSSGRWQKRHRIILKTISALTQPGRLSGRTLKDDGRTIRSRRYRTYKRADQVHCHSCHDSEPHPGQGCSPMAL